MKYLFLEYPKCSTSNRAKKWLNDNNIEYTARHIVDDNPTAIELEKWIKASGMPIKSFFNTSGLVYRKLNLKEKLDTLTDKEKYELLATDGMLVKRPIIIGENITLTGFKEDKWNILITDKEEKIK